MADDLQKYRRDRLADVERSEREQEEIRRTQQESGEKLIRDLESEFHTKVREGANLFKK